MKILILLDSLAVGGGAERVATIIGDQLYHGGYELHYLTFMDKNPKYKFEGGYHTLNQDKNMGNIIEIGLNFIGNSLRIKRICGELKIDTIISVGEISNIHAVLSRWLFRNKVNIVISHHINPEIHLKSSLKVNIIRFFYSKADKTVCVSRETEKILNEKFGVKNTMTIYNMLDLEKNIRLAQEKLSEACEKVFNQDLTENSFYFINLGSLFPQKGHCFLIRSFRKVVDHKPAAKLFILGEGDLREELEDLILKLDLNNKVFLLGNKENVFPFLKKSDCFVFSSLWEGFPMTLIEALSLNLPIISTDCKTGPREALSPELDLEEEIEYPFFGQYGVLNRPFPNEMIFKTLDEKPLNKSEQMLAQSMINMIENPDLRKKYSNGLKRAQKFDKEIIINIWKKLLERNC